jgi:hypothetical protein
MNPVYVKLEFEEAIEARKKLLSSQIGILELLKNLTNYFDLRDKERKISSKLKTEMNKIGNEINFLKEDLPETDSSVASIKKEPIKKVKKQAGRSLGLNAELEELNEKLRSLGA